MTIAADLADFINRRIEDAPLESLTLLFQSRIRAATDGRRSTPEDLIGILNMHAPYVSRLLFEHSPWGLSRARGKQAIWRIEDDRGGEPPMDYPPLGEGPIILPDYLCHPDLAFELAAKAILARVQSQ